MVNLFQTKAKPRGSPSRGSTVHCRVSVLPDELQDLFALVEGAEHDDATLPTMERPATTPAAAWGVASVNQV
jgi:hypothetical protein